MGREVNSNHTYKTLASFFVSVCGFFFVLINEISKQFLSSKSAIQLNKLTI